jgi:hypothetical protein
MAKLMSDAEALCFDVGNPIIIMGMAEPIWRIPIKEQRPGYKYILKYQNLEFKSSELLDDAAVRKEYFNVSNKLIYFTKREWNAFINAISEKAKNVDIGDYSGYFGEVLYVIACIWDKIIDTEPENLCCMIDKKDGFYYLPVVTAKCLIKQIHPKIEKKTIRTVLEKIGVKTLDDCYIEICGGTEKVWQLSVEKLDHYGVANWD